MRALKSANALISLIVLATALPSCNWWKKAEERGPVERVDAATLKVHREALENLKTARAAVLDFPEQLSLMGKIGITEDRTNIVPARVAGRIESIRFASGESVKRGQLLATLFSPDFVAAKEEYLLALKQARASDGKKADPSDFANLTQLARKKLETMGLSEPDIDALADDPPGSSSDDKKSLMVIRAPRSGVIINKSAVLGNLVNVGDTLFIIGDLSTVWFLGDLYPEDLPKVHKGQEVQVVVPDQKQVLTGELSFISPLVDPTTRTIKIRALIRNPDLALKADMYVQGNVILKQKKELLVPTQAVIRDGEQNVVFKRVSQPSVEQSLESIEYRKVPVTLGNEQNGMTAVVAGLQDGDEVVSDGALLLDAALNSTEDSK